MDAVRPFPIAVEHPLLGEWNDRVFQPLEISVMHGLKNALDPRGLMAPGNVL
jgi:hypothetical protein